MSAYSVTVLAPAKVNLYLAVSGLRPDGYHAVSTVLQALELADSLTITRSDSLSVACDGPLDIPARENLVHRAAVALGEMVGFEPSFEFHLTKRIPTGAGLGGGSSDAAAALAGMASLIGLDSDDPRIARVARALGADVAFFLTGGTALFGGRGEKLVRPLPTLQFDVAVVKPADSIATSDAYEAFDRLGGGASAGPGQVTDALRRQERAALAAALYNNMTEAAGTLVSTVPEAIAWCKASEGVMGAALCGSGSAVFALCDTGDTAARIAEEAAARGWWGAATRTSSAGVIVQRVEGRG